MKKPKKIRTVPFPEPTHRATGSNLENDAARTKRNAARVRKPKASPFDATPDEARYFQITGRANRKPANPLLGGFNAPSDDAPLESTAVKATTRAEIRAEMAADMIDALGHMVLTERQSEFVKAAFRSAIVHARRQERARA